MMMPPPSPVNEPTRPVSIPPQNTIPVKLKIVNLAPPTNAIKFVSQHLRSVQAPWLPGTLG